jgi:hypothetical protein
MELRAKNLRGKALGLVSLEPVAGCKKVAFALVWQWKLADAAGEAGGVACAGCFVSNALVRSICGLGLAQRKHFCYYDTDFFGSLLPGGRFVAGIFPSVA